MGFLSDLAQLASSACDVIVEGVIKTVDCTLQICAAVAEVTADACRWVADRIRKWSSPTPPTDPIHPSAKKADEPLVEHSINVIKEFFPAGVIETAIHSDPDERVKMIEELIPRAARAMGIKNPPEVGFFVPDKIEQMHSLCGGYCRSDNTLKLNVAMIISEEPELFWEQVSTIFHELIHARQHEALSAFVDGNSYDEYGYSVEYIQVLAENTLNYITPDENPEAYSKQPKEAEAFWFEEQIKPHIN